MAGREDGVAGAQRSGSGGAAWAEELLDQLRPAGRDVRKVVAWLAESVGGTACLLDGDGALLAGEPVALDEKLVADVLAGRLASAALQDRERHLRLVRVGAPPPSAAGVLAVARPTPFDRHGAELISRTAAVLELLLRAHETASAGRRLERATAALRLAVLQLLMVEDTVSARRVAAGLWPGFLDADTARVYVMEGRRDERDRLAADCLDATGGRALVVLCPADDEHVIVVAPGRGGASGGDGGQGAGDALRALVAARPGTYLGGSARHGLARTATGYAQAVSALAVARFSPHGAAMYAERTRPERLMDPEALQAWSARLLRPLDALPHHTRAELLATTRLGLEFTAVAAARILGVSRNTVRARMERAGELLGTDLTRLPVRAAVHLALNTQASLDPVPEGSAGDGVVRFADLLAGTAVRAWARELLGRLTADGRDLRGTLRAWIAAGGNAERAAHLLGMHAQTVREHVRGAEPVLERRLLATGSDQYEVVLAHLAAGDLEPPALGGESRPG
ncbi:helix-turn-helix domain-containing protein [Streptomyces anandii]|uniref:helix-turn-helix domain-containing protein n=1 Tax=Streptomyces anandii TaxID=285454 RepID=UPI00378BC604